MKATDLRIGNLCYYHIADEVEASEWDEVNVVDSDDLAILTNNPDDKNYKPIPLTKWWLQKCRAKPRRNYSFSIGRLRFLWQVEPKFWTVKDDDTGTFIATIWFVHELQNLWYALNNQELEFK